MKRSDDVFFFTLIDFLIQVFFFGLVLFVLNQSVQAAKDEAQKADAENVKKLLVAAGVSSLTELTDELTNLAPLKELKGMSDFISHNGGLTQVNQVNELVRSAGGVQGVKSNLDRLKKLEDGMGKPPCLYDVVGDKKIVKSLATVFATDTSIAFQDESAELTAVLGLLNLRFSNIRELPLEEFRKAFAALAQRKPECRYTLRFIEKTRLVDARDAARFSFYLNIGK